MVCNGKEKKKGNAQGSSIVEQRGDVYGIRDKEAGNTYELRRRKGIRRTGSLFFFY